MNFLALLLIIVPTIYAHSWMSCPRSFITTNGRGGVQDKPCETNGDNAAITEVHAGDRLKVGWTSNNHAGGYVRLSLVKFGEHVGDKDAVENNFKKSVLKFVCYGHNAQLGPNNGDCNHPCGARGGCSYQGDQYDIERYDTTIGIPTNLAEGEYVLQTALLVGNSKAPYYSCAKLKILRGVVRNCTNSKLLVYSCVKTDGPLLDDHFLRVGAKNGNFCYHFDERTGTTDDHLRDVPINVQCDPRITCDNAIHKSSCELDVPSMLQIVIKDGEPVQPGCYVDTVIPPSKPTCFDDIRNGDEQGVDCGGKFCPVCPPIVQPGEYFSSILQKSTLWGGVGGNFEFTIDISKNVSDTQCWQLILQFSHPLIINDLWGEARLVRNNTQKTIYTFEKATQWSPRPVEGRQMKVYIGASNPLSSLPEGDDDRVLWNTENIKLQSASTFYATDLSECEEIPLPE